MTIALIIISVILVLSVIAHYFFWKDSKRRYEENMKEAESIKERLKQLEANYDDMDGVLDAADENVERIGREIDTLRSALFLGKRKSNLDN